MTHILLPSTTLFGEVEAIQAPMPDDSATITNAMDAGDVWSSGPIDAHLILVQVTGATVHIAQRASTTPTVSTANRPFPPGEVWLAHVPGEHVDVLSPEAATIWITPAREA